MKKKALQNYSHLKITRRQAKLLAPHDLYKVVTAPDVPPK